MSTAGRRGRPGPPPPRVDLGGPMPPPRHPPPGPGVPRYQMAGPPPPRRRPAQPPPRLPRGPAPRRRAGRPELSDAAVVSRSWGMAFATLISRLTGFARIVLIATILGAALSSAFSVAYQLPNLIAALVLEATFTAIFVPVLARAERDDPDGGTAFVRRLVTLATTLLLITTALSVASAPLLVGLMLGDDPQVNRELTTAFAYLLLPQVLFYGLSSVFMAILNTRNVFGPPAWAPVCNNIVAIATLGLYLVVPGRTFGGPGADGQREAACSRRRHDAGHGDPGRGAARGHPTRTCQPAPAVGRRRPLETVRRDGVGDGALRADQSGRIDRRQPNRQRRCGFRPGDLQLHLAGPDAAVRHYRGDGADGGDATVEP